MDKSFLPILTIIIFIVPVSVFIPAFIDVTQTDTTEDSVIVETDQTTDVGQYLEFEVSDITSNESDISVFDTETGDSETYTITEGDNQTYAFENGDIHVTLEEIHTDNRVFLELEYPARYGWTEQEQQINSLLSPVVMLPILLIIMLVLYGVIQE